MPNLALYKPVSGRSSTLYGISMADIGPLLWRRLFRDVVGFPLRVVILVRLGAGQTVFVRPAMNFRQRREISVGRRRRRGPFQRRRVPRIVLGLASLPQAPEKIDDERHLEQRQGPRGV